MNLTVLIAEDDPAMRKVIRNAVMAVPGVEVVGEAGDGVRALELFEELRPRVVLIDIDLPEKDGLELAKEIFDIDPWTYLVFCTGFSDFREKAFEVYAFDYLVKPFKVERLNQTLGRILAVESAKIAEVKDNLPLKKRVSVQGARLFRDSERFLMVDLKDIIFITRENRRTTVHYVGGKVLTDETLGVLEEQLKENMFFRAHKGFLINLNLVREMIPCGKSTYQVIMSHTDQRPLITWDKLKDLERMTKIVVAKN
ncbi:MAG: LytR/AlgR family response regulator transcription factor [Desulfocucumaceae bacterium]